MVPSTLNQPVVCMQRPMQMYPSVIDVDETLVCITAVDDVIHRVSQRALFPLILILEKWHLDRLYYFYLMHQNQPPNQDSMTSAKNPFIELFLTDVRFS